MRSTLKKIFSDKTMRAYTLDYRETPQRREGNGPARVTRKARLIASLIEPGASVLDIGCGEGDLMACLLEELGGSVSVRGVDISAPSVQRAKERGLPAECADVLTMELPDDWKCDYLIMADFIEHIPDPERLLLRLTNHFRKAIIVSIPNTGYITSRLRLGFGGRFPVQWGHHPGEHLRFWTVKDFRWWAGQLGLRVVRVLSVRGSLLRNVWPSLFSAKNIFVLEKK